MSEKNSSCRSVRVKCYAGYRGEESPRSFFLAGHWVEVATVVDRWLAPDHRYFKIEDGQGQQYLLCHDIERHRWELASSSQASTQGGE